MTESEIKNAIKTINAQLENALQNEKETTGTHSTVIWHLVANDYRCAIKALDEIQQYRAIGTVEECREARERQRGKKPICNDKMALWDYTCPVCGEPLILQGYTYNYCDICGNRIDWSDTP